MMIASLAQLWTRSPPPLNRGQRNASPQLHTAKSPGATYMRSFWEHWGASSLYHQAFSKQLGTEKYTCALLQCLTPTSPLRCTSICLPSLLDSTPAPRREGEETFKTPTYGLHKPFLRSSSPLQGRIAFWSDISKWNLKSMRTPANVVFQKAKTSQPSLQTQRPRYLTSSSSRFFKLAFFLEASGDETLWRAGNVAEVKLNNNYFKGLPLENGLHFFYCIFAQNFVI